MQYTEIFLVLKIENFQLKNSDIFLIFAQNIDCGYTLEPPRLLTDNKFLIFQNILADLKEPNRKYNLQ